MTNMSIQLYGWLILLKFYWFLNSSSQNLLLACFLIRPILDPKFPLMLVHSAHIFAISWKLQQSMYFAYDLCLMGHLCHWNRIEEIFDMMLSFLQCGDFELLVFWDPPRSFLPTRKDFVPQNPLIVLLCIDSCCLLQWFLHAMFDLFRTDL